MYNAVKYDFYKRRMQELIDLYPHLFDKRYPVPLAIGIHKKLIKETHFTKQEISALLWVWVHRFEYVMMALSMGSRVDMDGKLTLISDEDRLGFIAAYKQYTINNRRQKRIEKFCKRHLKVFGRPALLGLPIRDRSF